MKDLLNAAEMKAVDQRSIEEYGIPSLVLMERAALEVVKRAGELLEPGLSGNEALEYGPGRERLLKERKRKTVWAVCGFGNNGADGAAAARMLTLQGFSSVILLPSQEGKRSRELEVQLSVAEKLGIPILTLGDPLPEACDLILDAVFGIGLPRPVEGVYKELIGLMEEKRQRELVPVAAVDMPSGISSDTGAVMGCAVKADVTVTFGMRKVGQALFPGREYCGRLFVEDVGFVPEDPEQAGEHVHAHGPEDLMEIPRRRADSHKGTYGKILVIAGAKNMAGAAYFSALAAYRTGAGLVKIMTVEENRSVIQERLPEAVLSSFDPQWASEEPGEFKEYIRSQTGWADAIVLGPGLGQEEYARTLVEAVLSDAYVPIVMDADAVNLAARYPYLKGYFTETIILTPHVLEFSRLTEKPVEEIKEDPLAAAREFSDQYGVTCVLKDAATVTARKDGKLFVNLSGSPAMAKGGSGDVLTGVIAGLLAMGMDDCEAASLGVYVHGLAGEAAEKKYGVHSVLAGELAGCIGEVVNGNV